MLIVVEGVDGVGKTTFANAVAEKIREFDPSSKVEMLHRGPPTRPPLEEYELDLQWYYPGDGVHVICDRWHVGDLIYGPLLRNTVPDRIQNFHIEKFLQARGTIVVGLVAPVSQILARRSKRGGEDLLSDEQVDHVQTRYFDELWDSSLTVHLVANITDNGTELERMQLETIVAAREHEQAVVNLAAFRSYVGPIYPQVVLLGERKNPNGDPRWDAAFVPGGGTAGRYLLSSLTHDVGQICGLANALEENVDALWNTLSRPGMVALGVKAHERLEELGIPHGSVPHPQYVRRFHHAHRAAYGQAIRRAAIMQEELLKWRP